MQTLEVAWSDDESIIRVKGIQVIGECTGCWEDAVQRSRGQIQPNNTVSMIIYVVCWTIRRVQARGKVADEIVMPCLKAWKRYALCIGCDAVEKVVRGFRDVVIVLIVRVQVMHPADSRILLGIQEVVTLDPLLIRIRVELMCREITIEEVQRKPIRIIQQGGKSSEVMMKFAILDRNHYPIRAGSHIQVVINI